MITPQRTDTTAISVLRLLPPVEPDRRTRLRMTRRGRIIRDLIAGTTLGLLVFVADDIAHAVVEFVVAVAPLVPGSAL